MTHQLHRARLPLEIYPVSAGVKGGLAGSVVMAVLAVLYGLIVQHSVWYPINLLAAGFFPQAQNTTAQLAAFQPDYLIIAVIIHSSLRFWSGCSMAQCFRCFRAARFCWVV